MYSVKKCLKVSLSMLLAASGKEQEMLEGEAGDSLVLSGLSLVFVNSVLKHQRLQIQLS